MRKTIDFRKLITDCVLVTGHRRYGLARSWPVRPTPSEIVGHMDRKLAETLRRNPKP